MKTGEFKAGFFREAIVKGEEVGKHKKQSYNRCQGSKAVTTLKGIGKGASWNLEPAPLREVIAFGRGTQPAQDTCRERGMGMNILTPLCSLLVSFRSIPNPARGLTTREPSKGPPTGQPQGTRQGAKGCKMHLGARRSHHAPAGMCSLFPLVGAGQCGWSAGVSGKYWGCRASREVPHHVGLR